MNARLLVCLFVTVIPSWVGAQMGPLQVTNRFPPHLMFLVPRPDSPRVPDPGQGSFSLAADYLSVFAQERNREWAALMDMEAAVLDFSFAYGLGKGLSVSVDMPVVRMDDGFLDSFLEGYHDAFGFPNYGRESRPDDRFGYFIRQNGRDWFQAKPGSFRASDGTISAKLHLAGSGEGFSAAAVYRLKIPLGDPQLGLGSGRFDHGLFFPMQAAASPVVFYAQPGIGFLSDPDTMGARVKASTVLGLFLGGEYLLSPKTSLLAQANFYTPPVRNTGIRQLDQDTLELSLGIIRAINPRLILEAAFTEDLTRAAPDFTVHVRVTCRFGDTVDGRR